LFPKSTQETLVKTYCTPRDLQAKIERVLQRRAISPTAAPLDEVAAILCEGRRYSWVGIYLVAGQSPAPGSGTRQAASQTTSESHVVVPIRLGQHALGAIEARSESGKPLTGQERILLKGVAARLAKYLHGPGAYLVRKAREVAANQPQPSEGRLQPASEKVPERTLAAGEGRR
jgi:putative methionine-R-sulfoxide reductase with GAF domain